MSEMWKFVSEAIARRWDSNEPSGLYDAVYGACCVAEQYGRDKAAQDETERRRHRSSETIPVE